MEREAAGYHEVEFGGANAPFVEALWRRDRVRYWSVVPPLAILFAAAAGFTRGWPLALVAALLLAPACGFLVAGLWSFAAQRGRGGVAWWIGALAALAAAMISAVI